MRDPERVRFQEEFVPDKPAAAARPPPGRLTIRVLVTRNDVQVLERVKAVLEEDGLRVHALEAGPVLAEVRGYDPGQPPDAEAAKMAPVVKLLGKTLEERLARVEAARATLRSLREQAVAPPSAAGPVSSVAARLKRLAQPSRPPGAQRSRPPRSLPSRSRPPRT